MLRNILDLRTKNEPQVVEKIIVKKPSFQSELFRFFLAIFIASALIWGVSNADTVFEATPFGSTTKNFSVVGTVSDIVPATLSLSDAHGTNDSGQRVYSLDISQVEKIESKEYVSLSLSDIVIGDKVIVQGIDEGGNIKIKRIIVVVPRSTELLPEVVLATSTPQVASSTEGVQITGDNSTSTTPLVENGTLSPEVITDSATTSPSLDASNSSTTDVQISEDSETNIPIVGPIIDVVTEVVGEAVQKVVDLVTPEEQPEPEPSPASNEEPAIPLEAENTI